MLPCTPQDTTSQSTRLQNKKSQRKKLFSDIAIGAFCCVWQKQCSIVPVLEGSCS